MTHELYSCVVRPGGVFSCRGTFRPKRVPTVCVLVAVLLTVYAFRLRRVPAVYTNGQEARDAGLSIFVEEPSKCKRLDF